MKETPVNDILRSAWSQLYYIARTDTRTTFTVLAVTVLVVGFLCLRGNIIKK